MRSQLKIVGVILILSILSLSIPTTQFALAAESITESLRTRFIDKVIPIDISKYSITAQYSEGKNGSADLAHFTLKSPQSSLILDCYVRNNLLCGCMLFPKIGQVLNDKDYIGVTNTATNFLKNYSEYTETDLSQKINMVKNVVTSNNSTLISNNIMLTITNRTSMGAELVTFRWVDVINGVNYTYLAIYFRDGIFYGFTDTHNRYTIGDTTVNTSREEAIDIAMKYIKTYSYAMPDGNRISEFKITENKTEVGLFAFDDGSAILTPIWGVRFYLNQTYPGSVYGLMVRIWAGSGEAFTCNNLAEAAPIPMDDEASFANSQAEIVYPIDNPPQPNNRKTDNNPFYTAVIAILIAATIAMVLVTIKRRMK